MLRESIFIVLCLFSLSAPLVISHDGASGAESTFQMERYPVPPDITMSTAAAAEADSADHGSTEPPKTAAKKTPVTFDSVAVSLHTLDESSKKMVSDETKYAPSVLASWIDLYYDFIKLFESKKNRRSPTDDSFKTESPEIMLLDPRRTLETSQLLTAVPWSTETPDTADIKVITDDHEFASSTGPLTNTLPITRAPAAPKKKPPKRKWKKPKKKPMKKLVPITTTASPPATTSMTTTTRPATTTTESAATTASQVVTWATGSDTAKPATQETSTHEPVLEASPVFAMLATFCFTAGSMIILPLVSTWTRVRRLRHRNGEGNLRSINGMINQRVLMSVIALATAALVLETQNGSKYESLVTNALKSGFGVIWILTVGFSLVFGNLSTRRSNFEEILLFAHKFLADVAFGFACVLECKFGISRALSPEGHSLSPIGFSPTWVVAMFGVYVCLKEILEYAYVIRRRTMIVPLPVHMNDPEIGQNRGSLSAYDRYRSRLPAIFKLKRSLNADQSDELDEVVVVATRPTSPTSPTSETLQTAKDTGDA